MEEILHDIMREKHMLVAIHLLQKACEGWLSMSDPQTIIMGVAIATKK